MRKKIPSSISDECVSLLSQIVSYRNTLNDLTEALHSQISHSHLLTPQRKAYWKDTVERVVQPESTYLFHLLERLADELSTGWPQDPSL